MNVEKFLYEFFSEVNKSSIEIYNEFSLQFELDIFLRQRLNKSYKVQLERNISFIKKNTALSRIYFTKQEMDLIIYKNEADINTYSVIELKGEVNQGKARPVTVFNWIEDIKLLEELKDEGAKDCFSIFLTDFDGYFLEKRRCGPLLSDFRRRNIKGKYQNHSTSKNKLKQIELKNEYKFDWNSTVFGQKYFIIKV